ncbi:hypothetical protein ABKN59_011871 [Abortiporus biennis]
MPVEPKSLSLYGSYLSLLKSIANSVLDGTISLENTLFLLPRVKHDDHKEKPPVIQLEELSPLTGDTTMDGLFSDRNIGSDSLSEPSKHANAFTIASESDSYRFSCVADCTNNIPRAPHLPLDAHMFATLGKHHGAILPLFCVGLDQNVLVSPLTSILYQRQVFGSDEPAIAILQSKDTSEGTIFIAWLEIDGIKTDFMPCSILFKISVWLENIPTSSLHNNMSSLPLAIVENKEPQLPQDQGEIHVEVYARFSWRDGIPRIKEALNFAILFKRLRNECGKTLAERFDEVKDTFVDRQFGNASFISALEDWPANDCVVSEGFFYMESKEVSIPLTPKTNITFTRRYKDDTRKIRPHHRILRFTVISISTQ